MPFFFFLFPCSEVSVCPTARATHTQTSRRVGLAALHPGSSIRLQSLLCFLFRGRQTTAPQRRRECKEQPTRHLSLCFPGSYAHPTCGLGEALPCDAGMGSVAETGKPKHPHRGTHDSPEMPRVLLPVALVTCACACPLDLRCSEVGSIHSN